MSLFMTSTFTDLILRVVLAFILFNYLGYSGIFSSWPVGWVAGAILSYSFFVVVCRRLAKNKQALLN